MALQGIPGPIYGADQGVAETEVTTTAESPIDGTMWLGTNGDGLYRLGKNGSRLHFGASGGKIGSDYIIYICFDSKGTLWIVDKSGTVTSYTTKAGFKKNTLENIEISRAILLPKEDKILIAGVTKLILFDTRSNVIENKDAIQFSATDLKLSSDSTFVWVFGENRVAKYAGEGGYQEWETEGRISNSLPLEFETYTDERASGAHVWIIVLACLAVCGCVLWAGVSLGRKKSKNSTGADTEEQPIQRKPASAQVEIAPSEEREKTSTTPKTKPAPVTKSPARGSEFTTKVMILIEDHIKEPDFDVEKIAALLGISRIHVNRKLKAEGAPSPSAMIKEKRMDRAKFYLLQSDLSMAQIASECGFRSPSYFTTAFKDYTGLTPSEFVAQNRL